MSLIRGEKLSRQGLQILCEGLRMETFDSKTRQVTTLILVYKIAPSLICILKKKDLKHKQMEPLKLPKVMNKANFLNT